MINNLKKGHAALLQGCLFNTVTSLKHHVTWSMIIFFFFAKGHLMGCHDHLVTYKRVLQNSGYLFLLVSHFLLKGQESRQNAT